MCDCIDKTNEALEKMGNNTKLDIPILITPGLGLEVSDRVLVATVKVDDHSRKKPAKLFAAYCPFCGKKYEDRNGNETPEG